MKTTILILLATVSLARANLIDLTPGGFDETQPLPKAWFHRFIGPQIDHRLTFFDAATPAGWDSCCGELNGGTFFFTNLIGNPGSGANVSWDFTTLPGWSMSLLLVEGELWGNLYAVGGRFNIVDALDQITLHDNLNIQSLEFLGRNPNSAPVPERGGSLWFFALGLLGLLPMHRIYYK